MTEEEIKEIIEKAGLIISTNVGLPIISLHHAEKFAELVAEYEREKCAKIAEWHKQMAFDIRARGQE
jgi:hypothetical protein